jgi:outer membrane protein assembly factor BamB
MLLGTPRYMSPEQAAAAKQPVDHRTDVYSLGATLYELATGKPVFTADTPQGIVAQILQDEPVAPRRLQSGLPRDLETVVLKCLAKEPARRYPTAQALTDDLRAFLDGRPVRARRPSLAERSVRWLRKHRRSAALMVWAATTAVLLMGVGLVGADKLRQWQQGHLYLATEGPVLTAEVLTEAGDPACPRFTVPTEEPLALEAGDYRLRLRGRGFLDETLQVQIERGKERAFTVGLGEQRLWEPLLVPKAFELADLSGRRHDVVLLSEHGVSRVHGGTGETIWSRNLERKDQPALAGWRWNWSDGSTPSGRNNFDYRPYLVQPPPDLDGDGTRDLVWASRRQAALLALSGKDGKVLWRYLAPEPEWDPRRGPVRTSTGTVVGMPAVADVDGDGVPDLIATFTQLPRADGTTPRWVEALSGRDGTSLWRYDLDGRWFVPPAGAGVPYDSRWRDGSSISMGSIGGSNFGQVYERNWEREWSAGVAVPYPAQVAHTEGRSLVVLAAGTRLVGLDLHSGRPAWPAHDLGFWPVRAPQVADLKGDGHDEVLLHRQDMSPGPPFSEALPVEEKLTLLALDLGSRAALWQATVRAQWLWNWYVQPFEWPVLADLDGDGKPEVIVPTGDVEGATKWVGVEVRSGATGELRWQRKLVRSSQAGSVQQVNAIAVGPDVDGDGRREVYTAVLDGAEWPRGQPFQLLRRDKDYRQPILLIDALSGKDGRSLWWSRQRTRAGALGWGPSVAPLRWWHAGADGWPQLVVSYVPGPPQGPNLPHTNYVVSAGTGRLLHTASDCRDVRIADLDGDGVPELVAFRADRADAWDHGGKLEVTRGRSPEPWRRLGGDWQLAGDLDGDGIPDLVTALPSDERQRERQSKPTAGRPTDELDRPRVTALSGRDGRILWQSVIGDYPAPVYPLRGPLGDLDGDGIPDLLVTGRTTKVSVEEPKFSPLRAVSGKTGRRLWEADMRVKMGEEPQLLECCDLDGKGEPVVLFASASDWGIDRKPGQLWSSADMRYWLAVFSGRDGTVRWAQPLSEPRQGSGRWATTPLAHALADLDGDGVRDVIVEAGRPDRDGEVRAFSGRDGTLLWRWVPEPRDLQRGWPPPSRPTLAVGDLDGDGRPTVLVLHVIGKPDAKGALLPRAEVLALDGRSGRPKWAWRHPVDHEFNNFSNGSVHSRVVPLIVNLEGGRHRAVCVWTWDYENRGQVVLLDARGKELKKIPVAFALNGEPRKWRRQNPNAIADPAYGGLFRVWGQDLDGDGKDDLLFFTRDRLRAMRGGLDHVLWEWPLPDEDCDLLRIVPAEPGRPAVVVVRVGDRVLGLTGNEGKPCWGCVGPGTPLAVVANGRPGARPCVVYDLGDEVTACRLAQPTDGRGGYPPATGFQPFGAAAEEDPRLVRPLPWDPPDLPPFVLPSLGALWGALFGVSLAVLVLPAAFLAWALRGRRWLLCLLPLPWLALVWTSAYLLFQVQNEADQLLLEFGRAWFNVGIAVGLLVLGVAGLPAVAFVGAALARLRSRQWGRLALLLVGSLLLAAAIGAVWLAYFPGGRQPERHYSWSGWYAIWPAGAYATGVVVLAVWVFVRVVHFGRWAIGRVFARVRAA